MLALNVFDGKLWKKGAGHAVPPEQVPRIPLFRSSTIAARLGLALQEWDTWYRSEGKERIIGRFAG